MLRARRSAIGQILRRPLSNSSRKSSRIAITIIMISSQIAIELMPSESQIPIASQADREAIRGAAGAVLRHAVRADRHPSAVFSGLAEGGRHRRVLDRDHHGGSFGDAVHDPAVRDRPCRKASVAARGHDRHRFCNRARDLSLIGTQHQPLLVFLAYAASPPACGRRWCR